MHSLEHSRQPYPGLRPFEADEADLFFGREKHVDALLQRLSRSHFVAVVGESGAGKSSLVRAGLLPALEAGFVVEAGSDWRIAVMRPASAPLSNLADALLAPGVLTDTGGMPHREFALAELRRGPLGLVQLIHDAHCGDHCNTLIVVDQFEELFRYCRQPAQKDQANVFVELLLNATAQRHVPIFVVLTMRSDFVGDCARFRGLPERLNDHQYLTPRLTRNQIAAVIREPARVCGGVIEDDLVDELCNAVGDDQDQLPLLQHLLLQLWNKAKETSQPGDTHQPWPRLTSELSRQCGGLRLALNNHAQQIYEALPQHDRDVARVLFKSLTDPRSQRRDLRRDALVSEVAAVGAVPVDRVIGVADEFRATGRHMLMPPSTIPLDAGSRLDVSHESLLRQWSTLKQWAREEATNAREFDRLREEAQRERAGEGQLLSGRALARAQDWIKNAAPTAAWAERYAPRGEFDATLAFIQRSEDEARRSKQAEALAGKREADARRAKSMYGIGGSMAVVVAIVFSIFWMRAEKQKEELDHAREQAHAAFLMVSAERLLTKEPKDASLAVLLARAAVREGADVRAERVLGEAIAAHVPNIQPDLTAARSRNYIPGKNKTQWLDFSLAPASVSPVDGSAITPSGKTAVIWSTVSGAILQTLQGHEGIVGSAIFSPDGRLAVTTAADNSARVWDVATGRQLHKLTHTQMINGAVFNRSGTLLVTLGDDALAKVWTVGDDTTLKCNLPGEGSENFILGSFSQDQRYLATVTHRDGTWGAQVWNVSAETCPNVVIPALDDIDNVKWASFSPYGASFAVVTTEGVVTLLGISDWKPLRRPFMPDVLYQPERARTASEDLPPPIAWSSDGRSFAAAGGDNTIYIAPVSGNDRSIELRGHTGRVTSIDFSPAGAALLTTSNDKSARLWTLDPDKRPIERLVLSGHADTVASGVFSPDGDRIVTAGDEGKMRSWTPLLGLRQLANIASASYSADGNTIMTIGANADGTEDFWSSDLSATTLVPRTERRTINTPVTRRYLYDTMLVDEQGDSVTVRELRHPDERRLFEGGFSKTKFKGLSPSGRFVIAVADDDEHATVTLVFDLSTPRARPQITEPPASGTNSHCRPVGISDDQQIAWYCPDENRVLIAHPGQPHPMPIQIEDDTKVESVRFSSSTGNFVALALADYSVRVFDIGSKEPRSRMVGHSGEISGMDFSEDNRFLVSTSADSTTRVWSIATGVQSAIAAVPGMRPTGVTFSPDGLSLLVRSSDRLLVWRCYACGDTARLLKEVDRRQIVRTLSKPEVDEYHLDSQALMASAAAHHSHESAQARR